MLGYDLDLLDIGGKNGVLVFSLSFDFGFGFGLFGFDFDFDFDFAFDYINLTGLAFLRLPTSSLFSFHH